MIELKPWAEYTMIGLCVSLVAPVAGLIIGKTSLVLGLSITGFCVVVLVMLLVGYLGRKKKGE